MRLKTARRLPKRRASISAPCFSIRLSSLAIEGKHQCMKVAWVFISDDQSTERGRCFVIFIGPSGERTRPS